MHHVGRRHDLTVRRDEHAGARLGEARLTARAHLAPFSPDHDDGRRDLAEDLAEGLRANRDGNRHDDQHREECRSGYSHAAPSSISDPFRLSAKAGHCGWTTAVRSTPRYRLATRCTS